MIEIFKKTWQIIVGVVGTLIALFFISKTRSPIVVEKAPQDGKVEKLESDISAINDKIKDVKDSENKTDEELVDILNKRYK